MCDSMRALITPVERAARRITSSVAHWAVTRLTEPVKLYHPSEVTNLKALKRQLKPSDVLLVSGNARISHVVKVLTLSQWSHVVLYVGDRRELLTVDDREEWTRRFGEAALAHLVVDADPVRGVHLKPLDDSVGLMVRHCRATALSASDRKLVVERALSQLGREYDSRHIGRLLLFFGFPWELLPEGWRRAVTDFTLSEDDRICSRVVSEAFHSVGYPIRPLEVLRNKASPAKKTLAIARSIKHRGRSAVRLLAGGRLKAAVNRLTDDRYAQMLMRGTRYITPADYDLSRFFDVIKNPEDLSLDYRSAEALAPTPLADDS